MRSRRLGLLVVLTSLLALPALAQVHRPLRRARSENKRFVLRVERGRETRKERMVWTTKLVNEIAPVRAFVRNDGRFVVTLDEFRRGGARHALVVYGADGKLVREFGLADLLVRADWKHVKVRKRDIEWLTGARFAFEQKPAQFVIKSRWGRQIRIDLERPRVASTSRPAEHTKLPPEAIAWLEASGASEAFADLSDEEFARLFDELVRLIEEQVAAGGELTGDRFAQLVDLAGQRLEVESRSADAARALAEGLSGEGASGGALADLHESADIDEDLDTPVGAGNSSLTGVAVPEPNPADPIDYLAWFNEQSVTDGEGAGPNFQAARDAFVPWQPPDGDDDRDLHSEAMHGDPDALRSPEIIAWLEANREAAAHFRAGAQFEFRGSPRDSADGTLLGILLPHLAPTRSIAKMMVIEGKRLEVEGHGNEAMTTYLDTLASGAKVSHGPTLIENLVGLAIQNLASGFMLDSFEGPAAETIDYIALAERIEEAYLPARPMAESLQFERAMILDVVQRAFRWNSQTGHYEVDPDGLRVAQSAFGSENEDPLGQIGLGLALGAIGFEETRDATNDHYDELSDGFSRPYPEGIVIFEDIDRRLEDQSRWALLGGGNPLLQALLPALSRVYKTETRAEARRRATILTANLMAYRQRYGIFPDSLDVFAEKHFAIDPFSEERFVYRREDDGFVLYSLGEDIEDDGGERGPVGTGKDLVFWPREKK
ncbi:MAG: hypothetical protein IH986_13410 [Planctomycetes bacterium]|nr:hypothetical protein [Planctomycetota bacterium]